MHASLTGQLHPPFIQGIFHSLPNEDDVSDMLPLPSPMPFGDVLYHSVYVSWCMCIIARKIKLVIKSVSQQAYIPEMNLSFKFILSLLAILDCVYPANKSYQD